MNTHKAKDALAMIAEAAKMLEHATEPDTWPRRLVGSLISETTLHSIRVAIELAERKSDDDEPEAA